jgi:hypothetical protein
MGTYLNEVEDLLTELVTLKIERNDPFGFLINNRWVNEINRDYFLIKIERFKLLLRKQLKYGLRQEEYLQKVGDRIKDKKEFLENHKVGTLLFLQSYGKEIGTKNELHRLPHIDTRLYKKFKASLEAGKTANSDLFTFLVDFADNKLDYQNFHDFEIGLLNYTVWNYYKALTELHKFILGLQDSARYTDFKNLVIEEDSAASEQVKADIKMHFNLPKKDVACLFRYFLEEKIIAFDDNDVRNNELQMKRFVDTYITYLNPSGQKVPMKNFNREYSEAKAYLNKEKYKSFIDRFSAQIVDYRNSLKD